MESRSGWNGSGMARWSHWPGPAPPSPLSKGRCGRLVPAAAVGGDKAIARASVTPPEIALVNVKKRDRTNNRMECSRTGGLCGAPSPWPSADSHRSHHRGDLAMRPPYLLPDWRQIHHACTEFYRGAHQDP